MTPRFYANARPKRFTGIVVIFCLFLSVSAFILGGQAFACPPPGDGPPENPPTEVGDPVSVTSGKVRSPQRDLLIPGRGGLSLEISRNYYSKSGYAGPFGRGWSFTYGMNITQETTTTTVLINEKGKKEEYTWDGNSWSPPASNFSTLTKNQDNTWTLRRKVAMAYNFDTEGKPINIKDRNDNRINLVYANGLLASVTDDNGRSLIFSCTDGKITSITWPNNEVTAYTYHPDSGNLAAVTDPEGNQESYAYEVYNGAWELTTVTDSRGNATAYVYYDVPEDPNYLKCKRITYADETPLDPNDNPHMDLVYNESLRFTSVTNERGHTTIYEYDGNENITGTTDPLNNKISYVYDADFNKTSVTDAVGHTTYYTYDDRGNRLSVTDPLGRVNGFTYEPEFCFVKTAVDAMGNATAYYYDYEEAGLGDLNGDGITNQAGGNLVKIVYPAVDAATPAELFEYNQYGQIIRQTDANGAITKYDYYPATGYLEKKTADYGDASHINAVTLFGYDALGNVTSVTDPLGNMTANEYNKIGLLVRTISPPPFNYQTKYYYDGNKNLIRTERQITP